MKHALSNQLHGAQAGCRGHDGILRAAKKKHDF